MRTLPWPDGDEALELLRSESNLRTASAFQICDEVLQAIDDQLSEFGLEIVQFESGSDMYIWKIEHRAAPSRVRAAQGR